ncbi:MULTISPECIES: tungsten ABC transporter permease [Methylomonas]|uniref:tungsten ABC transporter permease n=1 Tax=Methylomonas TaxID=416 RepID=UPI001681B5AE|nr:tungsten ABC transporter permease [Methylomonas rhizoryzae]
MKIKSLLHLLPLLLPIFSACPLPAGADPNPLRVAVVGGLALCGVWDKLTPRIEAATAIKLVTVSADNKEGILPDFSNGKADLLLVHGGDETFQLQALGIGGRQQVWGFNEHVVVGPENDPAGIGAAPNAAAAFKRIAAAHAPFLAFRDPGSHAMVQKIWRRAGIRPTPDWVLPDETADPHDILTFASARRAYVVVGHIPVAFGKLRGDGLKVLLKGDANLRKAYVVMEPGKIHSASPQTRQQAAKVADFLVSPAGQAALVSADAEAGGPWLFSLAGAKDTGGPGSDQGRRQTSSGEE